MIIPNFPWTLGITAYNTTDFIARTWPEDTVGLSCRPAKGNIEDGGLAGFKKNDKPFGCRVIYRTKHQTSNYLCYNNHSEKHLI